MFETQEQLQKEWESRRVEMDVPTKRETKPTASAKPGRKPTGKAKAAVKPELKYYAISESELAVFELGTALLKTLAELPQAKALFAEMNARKCKRMMCEGMKGESPADLAARNKRKDEDLMHARADAH